MNEEIRIAKSSDALNVSLLYHEVYEGAYPDPTMSNIGKLRNFITREDVVWVLGLIDGEIAGSVVYELDFSNRLAKVFAGVVRSQYRGLGLLEKCMAFGEERIREQVDVIYATTRTASKAPQVITERLGYKKLGIFPNIHKTDVYETHALTAKFQEKAWQQRPTDFTTHPNLRSLCEIVSSEIDLPAFKFASIEQCKRIRKEFRVQKSLEYIDAQAFVGERFRKLKQDRLLFADFYPFHKPNCILTSATQDVEIFLCVSPTDKYCTVVGFRFPEDIDTTSLVTLALRILRDEKIRYVESIVRADQLKLLDAYFENGMIPSAYFPAFQLHEGERYDYVAFSRSFETLDFTQVKLAGRNYEYLCEYYRNWHAYFTGPTLSSK